MAKFIDDWEPPRMTEKEGSYGWIWILILFIVLGLVVFYLMQQPRIATQTVTETSQETASEGGTSGSSEPSAAVNVASSNTPEMNSKCTAVAGVVPGTVVRDGSKVSVTFKNNGKVGIEGSYFEFSSDEKKIYKTNSEAVAVGEAVSYTVDLDEAAGELGSAVKSFVVLPIQEGKACLNQRMVVIK